MLRDGVGWGAPSGVTAGYLAEAGFTGAPALTCEGEAAAPYWADLGSAWRTVEQTDYKPYPCCRWAHPAIDAVADLMARHNLTHRDIAEVRIRTFHNATRLAGYEPKTLDEFSYAIAFPVAAMIVRGQLGVAELAPDALHDPDILRISRATTLIDDDEMTRISVGKRWAQVTLIGTDGRVFADAARSPRGGPDAPMSDAEILQKFHAFADPVIGTTRAAHLADLSSNFDSLDCAGFARLLDACLEGP